MERSEGLYMRGHWNKLKIKVSDNGSGEQLWYGNILLGHVQATSQQERLTSIDNSSSLLGDWILADISSVDTAKKFRTQLSQRNNKTRKAMCGDPFVSCYFVGYSVTTCLPMCVWPPPMYRLRELETLHCHEDFDVTIFRTLGSSTETRNSIILHEHTAVDGNLRMVKLQTIQSDAQPWPTGPASVDHPVTQDNLSQFCTKRFWDLARGDCPPSAAYSTPSRSAPFGEKRIPEFDAEELEDFFTHRVPLMTNLVFSERLTSKLREYADQLCRLGFKVSLIALRFAIILYWDINTHPSHMRESNNGITPQNVPVIESGVILGVYELWLRHHEERRAMGYLHINRWAKAYADSINFPPFMTLDEVTAEMNLVTARAEAFPPQYRVPVLPRDMPNSSIIQDIHRTSEYSGELSRVDTAMIGLMPITLCGTPVFSSTSWPLLIPKSVAHYFYLNTDEVRAVPHTAQYDRASILSRYTGEEGSADTFDPKPPHLLAQTAEPLNAEIWIPEGDPLSSVLSNQNLPGSRRTQNEPSTSTHANLRVNEVRRPPNRAISMSPRSGEEQQALNQERLTRMDPKGILGRDIREALSANLNQDLQGLTRLIAQGVPMHGIRVDARKMRIVGDNGHFLGNFSADDIAVSRQTPSIEWDEPEDVGREEQAAFESRQSELLEKLEQYPCPIHRSWARVSKYLREWEGVRLVCRISWVKTRYGLDGAYKSHVFDWDYLKDLSTTFHRDGAQAERFRVADFPSVAMYMPRRLARLLGVDDMNDVGQKVDANDRVFAKTEWSEILRDQIQDLTFRRMASRTVFSFFEWDEDQKDHSDPLRSDLLENAVNDLDELLARLGPAHPERILALCKDGFGDEV